MEQFSLHLVAELMIVPSNMHYFTLADVEGPSPFCCPVGKPGEAGLLLFTIFCAVGAMGRFCVVSKLLKMRNSIGPSTPLPIENDPMFSVCQPTSDPSNHVLARSVTFQFLEQMFLFICRYLVEGFCEI
jgi:hypothetical protein